VKLICFVQLSYRLRSDRMARKLKTYQTSIGFFDLAIAAPSMKAALDAWGSSIKGLPRKRLIPQLSLKFPLSKQHSEPIDTRLLEGHQVTPPATVGVST
jgi:hypothetical protein